MYCPECGADHHAPAPVVEAEAEVVAVEEVTSAEVEIERIRADKEVKIARIQAGVAESELVAEAAHAEGVAEGMAEAVAPAEPEAAPVVIVDAPAEPAAEPEVPEIEPPPPARESSGSSGGYGSRSWFGGR